MPFQTGLTHEVIRAVEAKKHAEVLPDTKIMAGFSGAHFIHARNAPNATVVDQSSFVLIHFTPTHMHPTCLVERFVRLRAELVARQLIAGCRRAQCKVVGG